MESPCNTPGESTEAGAEWAWRGWGVGGKDVGAQPPATLLMALGSSRPLWGRLCGFLIISHWGPTRAAAHHGQGASSPLPLFQGWQTQRGCCPTVGNRASPFLG